MAEDFEQADWANTSFKKENSGNLVVLFHAVQKHMKAASLEQGRPVFKEVIHITKIVPGDKNFTIDRPVREEDKEEYANRWAHFERTRENKTIGFPIENWPSISETQKAEFKAMKINTVEQFASLSDAIVQTIMGGSDIRRKAQIFIEAGKDAELLADVRREASQREIDLKAEIAELRALIESRTSPADLSKPQKVHA